TRVFGPSASPRFPDTRRTSRQLHWFSNLTKPDIDWKYNLTSKLMLFQDILP
ncbi:hypothetical protein CEXT_206121, partial [Caerostris extrusa]